MVYKCLGCRGVQNSGRLHSPGQWSWKAVTVRSAAGYHLVRCKKATRRVAGGGWLWDAETACGEEMTEEVPDED